MIIEGLCTTRHRDGSINLAPMGPVVDAELTSFLFRPFKSSTTYANLKATGCGVFHVTDDVELIARAAVGAGFHSRQERRAESREQAEAASAFSPQPSALDPLRPDSATVTHSEGTTPATLPEMFPAVKVDGMVLASACRWYEFEVVSIDESSDRTVMETRLLHIGRLRDYFGLNRAKHAVLELAILATRLPWTDREEIDRQREQCGTLIEKTAGDAERRAFAYLCEYIDRQLVHNRPDDGDVEGLSGM